MEKRGMLMLIGACTISALLGIGMGYLVFGPIGFSAQINGHVGQYAPASEPEFLLADFDIFSDSYATNPPDYPVVQSPESYHRFLVTSHDGYIAVYHTDGDGSNELMEVTTTRTNALPLVEQQRLAHGIRIYTEEALIRILEDYGS